MEGSRLRSAPPRLSVVIPCYNEAESIKACLERVRTACERHVGSSYEVIVVNDGSRDATPKILRSLADSDSHLVVVNLSRNYGHQLALSAGLSFVRGELILVLDADLQDPPELLGDMLHLIDAGADVVFGQRATRSGETWFKIGTARMFYRLMNKLSDIEIPLDAGDFRLMRRRVVDALNKMPEAHRFIRGMVPWIGFKQVPIVYEREVRFGGRSAYSFRRMVLFALDAITGFSIAPLRLAFFLALGFMAFAFCLSVYVVGVWWLHGTVQGWASILLLLLVFSSVQLLCTSIVGEYVGRTYIQTKNRPLFLVDEIYTNSGDRLPPAPGGSATTAVLEQR